MRLKEILEDTYEINDSVSSASAYLRLTMVLNQMYVLRVVGINQQSHNTREQNVIQSMILVSLLFCSNAVLYCSSLNNRLGFWIRTNDPNPREIF